MKATPGPKPPMTPKPVVAPKPVVKPKPVVTPKPGPVGPARRVVSVTGTIARVGGHYRLVGGGKMVSNYRIVGYWSGRMAPYVGYRVRVTGTVTVKRPGVNELRATSVVRVALVKPGPKPVVKPGPKPLVKPGPKPVVKPGPKAGGTVVTMRGKIVRVGGGFVLKVGSVRYTVVGAKARKLKPHLGRTVVVTGVVKKTGKGTATVDIRSIR